MAMIDLAKVNEAIDSSLGLLKNCFHRDPLGGGGWYHQLEIPRPGPTATALAIAAYHSCARRPEYLDECLEFLRLRQITSSDRLVNGGWANNTSMGHPVVEATGWVTWALARSRCAQIDKAPDVEAGFRWLVANQNKDGGWGSFRSAPSRVWLTCVAALGMTSASPYDPILDSVIEWLMAQRNGETGGWGQVLGAPSTTTHTALALFTIGSVRPHWRDKQVLEAYDWLSTHLDRANIDDQHARVESYNVDTQGPNGQEIWAMSLLHYGLPWAVSAFLKHPVQPPGEDISAGVETILRSRLPVGAWPNIQGGGGNSIWAVWPFLEALSSFRNSLSLVPDGNAYLSNGMVVLQDKSRKRQDILALIRTSRRVSLIRFFARFWPTLLVMASVLSGILFVWLKQIEIKDYLLGLIVPLGIYVIQEIRHRTEAPGDHRD
jgi:hypothetical protein